MNAQLPMFDPPTSEDSPNATSSPGADSGRSPCASLDGPTTGLCGPEAAHAPVSPRQAKERGLTTLVISGRHGSVSSASAALQSALESRLLPRLDMAGSTLFAETWKRKATPLRRRYWEHTASVRRTSGSGCTSVPSPKASAAGPDYAILDREESGGISLATATALASVPTPMAGSPATETYNAAGNTDYSRRIVELASTATPKASDGQGGRTTKTEGGGNAHLDIQVRLCNVPTPSATERSGQGPKNSSLMQDARLSAVTAPSARDWKDTSGMSESGVDPDGSIRSRLDQLPRQAQLAASGPTATGGTGATASTGQLDPAYSRWLMGVPPEWDAFACTATRLLSLRRRHSSKPISKRKRGRPSERP